MVEWNFLAVFADFDLLLLGLVNTLKVTALRFSSASRSGCSWR